MRNSTARLAILLTDGAPVLAEDTRLDSFPDRDSARAMARQYARLLVKLELASRFGVHVRHLGNASGWTVLVGPHSILQGRGNQ